jgi:predicted alpha/beta-hydrolase family hydrolase
VARDAGDRAAPRRRGSRPLRRAIDTPYGEAVAHLHPVDDPHAAIVLGHGAGGGVEAPDLVAATEAARTHGLSVALVEQPYRAAGRRAPPAASRLDASWLAAVERLAADELAGLPLVVGGRSLGARVACRTVAATGAIAVLCLAFPLQPRPRKGKAPPPSRLGELDAVEVPVLVVQGERDQFGIPRAGEGRTVSIVAGDHSLRADVGAVEAAVGEWLAMNIAVPARP